MLAADVSYRGNELSFVLDWHRPRSPFEFYDHAFYPEISASSPLRVILLTVLLLIPVALLVRVTTSEKLNEILLLSLSLLQYL